LKLPESALDYVESLRFRQRDFAWARSLILCFFREQAKSLMKPGRQAGEAHDLFRARLNQIINPRHERVLLAARIDGSWIEAESKLPSRQSRKTVRKQKT